MRVQIKGNKVNKKERQKDTAEDLHNNVVKQGMKGQKSCD